MPKNTAFLLLAHGQPELSRRLLGRLQADWSHAFVHVDAKTPIETFTSLIPEGPDVTYVRDRVSVNWGGFSMVRAELNLMKTALAGPYERLFLISGADYPIKPIEQIGAALEPDQEIIRVDPVTERDGHSVLDRRAYTPFIGDNKWLAPRTASPRIHRLRASLERRVRRKAPGPVYRGAQWWCLTRQTAEYLVGAQDSPQARYFRYTLNPDEMIFQTLLKQSDVSTPIAQDAAARPLRATLHATHFADFPPGASAPRVLTMSDWGVLRRSDALLARKFDLERSRELMDALDRADG